MEELVEAPNGIFKEEGAEEAPREQTLPWEFGPEGVDLSLTIRSIEEQMIQRALALTKGSQKLAAGLLRIKRTTLVEKIRRSRLRHTLHHAQTQNGEQS